MGSGHVRTSPGNFATVKDWPLRETQNHVKSFVAFYYFYLKFNHHFAEYSAFLTDLCRKYLPWKVAHLVATRADFETLKARMLSASVLMIPKSSQNAEFDDAPDAT